MNEDNRHPDMPQEEDNVPWRKVLLATLASLALGAVMVVAAWGILRTSEAELRPSGLFPEQDLGLRRVVAEVHQDLLGPAPGFGQLQNEQKQRAISTYGWVSRERRLVRIPIDQAMDIVVEENR